MSIWNFSGNKDGGRATVVTGRPPSGPQLPVPSPDDAYGDFELDDEPEEQQYFTRPVSPVAQTAIRVGLWAAVGLGAVGGILSLLRGSPPAPVVEPTVLEESLGLPAPVANVAEQVSESWLTVDDDSEKALRSMFIQAPELDRVDTSTIQVLQSRAVAGQRLDMTRVDDPTDNRPDEVGYWSVTVAVELVETVDGSSLGNPTTWYVEVGIVGSIGKGLRALTTPAVVPAPQGIGVPWRPVAPSPEIPRVDDRIADTVEGFLRSLLAGTGATRPYLAPGVDIVPADPAPFTSVDVTGISTVELPPDPDDPDAERIRIWVLAEVLTPGGSTHVVGYELKAIRRIDDWEILSVWGAPALEGLPDGELIDQGDLESPNATTSTTESDDGSGSETDGEGDGEEPIDASGEGPGIDATSSTSSTTTTLP